MSKECVVSLKFNVPDNFSKIKFVLAVTAVLFCIFPRNLGSETLTLTTYYPAPYGGYASILTTGRTILARDSNDVVIGSPILTPPAPNGAAGNLYVNDVYLRARGLWASKIPKTTIYTAGKVPGLSCALTEQTLIGGGCNAGWSFDWGPWTIGIGPFSITIPGFTWGIVVGCGTVPFGDGKTMGFFYPGIPPAQTWISCVSNR